MRRHVFLRIFKRVSNNDEYFQLRNDAIGRISLSSLHKCVVAIHMLAYGSLTDSTNKYVRIGCMHWEWKNCPTTWKDQYQRGDREKATIMLEVVTSHDLWIWHATNAT